MLARVVFCLALLLVAAGCTGGNQTVKGQVLSVDAGAATFVVKAESGREYRFRMTADSQGDLAEIKQHLDRGQPLAVTYRGTVEPYEVISAD